jgi:hypothetical protein
VARVSEEATASAGRSRRTRLSALAKRSSRAAQRRLRLALQWRARIRGKAFAVAERRRLSGLPAFVRRPYPTVRSLLRFYPLDAGGVHVLSERLRLGGVRLRDLQLCIARLDDLDGYDHAIFRQSIAKAALLAGESVADEISGELAGKRVALTDIRSAEVVDRTVYYEGYVLPVPPIETAHADHPFGQQEIDYPVARAEVVRLKDALASVGSDLLESGGRYYVDNNAWPGARSQNLVNDSRLFAVESGQAIVANSGKAAESIDRAIWLGFPMLENWGHWVYEGMLRLELLAREPDFSQLDILVPVRVPARFLDVANIVFPSARFRRVVDDALYLIGECVYTPLRTFHAHNVFWSQDDEKLRLNGEPQLAVDFRERVRREVGAGSDGKTSTERVYLDRSLASYRVSRNAARLRETAASHGFKVIDPGELTPLEQLQMFLSAKAIWGQTGSGLFLTPLAPGGCSIMMVGSDFSHDWAGLAVAIEATTLKKPEFVLGARDFIATGFSEKLYHQDFTLSEEAWTQIERWCSSH